MIAPAPPSAGASVVAVNMGYGHLRPAAALATELSTTVRRADEAPLADSRDRATFARMHALLVSLSLAPETPFLGARLRHLLDAATFIPRIRGRGRLSAPNGATRYLSGLIDRGFGRNLVGHLRRSGETLVSTFYAQPIAADAAGVDRLVCVVTDAEVNRVWVASDPAASRVRYCVPLRRTARRLEAYGVDPRRITVTGFPLPPGLVGGRGHETLVRNLGARLRRLDPAGAFRRAGPASARAVADLADDAAASGPVQVTFAIGGAGAQADLATQLVRALREPLARGAMRLTLVAGVRRATATALTSFVARHAREALALGAVEVLHEPSFDGYLGRFEACLARTDVLWTKPSEMTFYGALGLPLVLTPPLGFHERINGRIARRRGFGFVSPPAGAAASWLEARLLDGSLARAAWAGRERMPCDGTYRIADLVRGVEPALGSGRESRDG